MQRARHLQQFVLAVAPDKVNLLAIVRRDEHRCGGGRVEALLVDARQVVGQPFVETGGQHGVGGHDVDPLQPRKSRQQIEVGRPQSVGIGRLVGERDHDGNEWTVQPARDQPPPQAVLVMPAGLRAPPLEGAEGGGQESRLLQQAPRAAVQVRAHLEIGACQAVEAVDGLAPPAQLVVELQD